MEEATGGKTVMARRVSDAALYVAETIRYSMRLFKVDDPDEVAAGYSVLPVALANVMFHQRLRNRTVVTMLVTFLSAMDRLIRHEVARRDGKVFGEAEVFRLIQDGVKAGWNDDQILEALGLRKD